MGRVYGLPMVGRPRWEEKKKKKGDQFMPTGVRRAVSDVDHPLLSASTALSTLSLNTVRFPERSGHPWT